MPPWPPVKARTYKNGLNLSPSRAAGLMSALPPKADMIHRSCDVRFVPKADIWQRNTRSEKSATCCGDDETEAGRCCDFNEAHA
jgi:hypothetical protein